MIDVSAPPQQQEGPLVPNTAPPLVMEEYQGVNTQTTRPGVDDKQCFWIDGYIPLARRNLRTLYGVDDPLWTAPVGTTIVVAFWGTDLVRVFLSDGSMWVVNANTAVATQSAPPGTIQNPSQANIGFARYGGAASLIVANQVNGYFIEVNGTFYSPGQVSPLGTVPTGIGGTAVEVYTGRVWVATGSFILFSAPGSAVDFTTASGGGSFQSTDSFLRVAFIRLQQTNGFLYLIADSSINYISGVQTSGTPPTTTFTNQNADPEVGTVWPNSVQVWNRNIVIANSFGVHVSFGSAVTKVSDMLDGVYQTVDNFGSFIPSSSKAIIFGRKVFMLLLPIIDPITGQQVNKLLMWDSKNWWASEQDVDLVYIFTREIQSRITSWGTDGTSLYLMFAQPSTALTKRVQSKFWDTPVGYQTTKTTSRFWGLAQYFDFTEPDVTLSVESENAPEPNVYTLVPSNTNSLMNWTTNGTTPMTWTTPPDLMIWSATSTGIVVFQPQAIGQQGVLLGFTLTTNCADMAHISDMIQPSNWDYRG